MPSPRLSCALSLHDALPIFVKRVVPEGETMCGLCSRLRRGALYRVAREVGATKIALGHHRDDILEKFFLNLFFGGRMKAMSPKRSEEHTSELQSHSDLVCRLPA